MKKELVIIYDTPCEFHHSLIERQNLHYFLKYFNRLHILYWAKEKDSKVFEKENGQFVFHPYTRPYNSNYSSRLKYMGWIFKTLWQVCQTMPQEIELTLMPIMPVWPGIPVLLIGKLKKKKVILKLEAQKIAYVKEEDESLGVPKIFTAIKVLILKIIYFLIVPACDLVIGISKEIVEEAEKYKAKKTIWVPMFINLDRFKPGPEQGKKEKLTILSIGQIKKRKGFGEIIQALQDLKQESKLTPKLIIVGEVTNKRDEIFFKEFKEMAQNIEVDFKGLVDHAELTEIYKQTDIFILVSYVETLGIVILEAMASGLPVIATETSGAKDLVEHKKTGFLVPIKDHLAIKEKIKILLESQDLRKSMGQAGRERIKKIKQMIDEQNKKLWQQHLNN